MRCMQSRTYHSHCRPLATLLYVAAFYIYLFIYYVNRTKVHEK